MKLHRILFALFAVTLILGGCSKDDDPIPSDGEVVSPDANVPDPDGTVQISMLNNDKTSLDGLYIDASNNFHGDGWMIASLGKMHGLGNLRDIPFEGWAENVPVTAGNGYVAHNDISDEYIRIFVVENISDSAAGGVSGAEVKYQKPFKGLDKQIDVDMTTVVLPAEGATQQVSFKNENMIPFTVESSAEWCKVQKASTRDFGFLYDALVISCDESYTDSIAEATVTITTLYGKTTEIAVTRQARGPFITFAQPETKFIYPNYVNFIRVFSNISHTDIEIEPDCDWVYARFDGYRNARKVRFIDGRPLTRALLDNPVAWTLRVQVDDYAFATSGERTGNIVLSNDYIESKLKVIQYSMNFSIDKTDFLFEADANLRDSTEIHWANSAYNLDFVKEEDGKSDWCNVRGYSNYIYVSVGPNPYEFERSTSVKILYDNKLEFATLNITQKACKKFEDQYICFDKNSSSISVLYPVPEDCQISSTADWCTATAKGTYLTVSVTPTTQNRTAVISVAGVDAKVYVSQSKYAVGENYSEDGVTGKVYKMDNGTGYIYQEINKRISWSTQTVLTAGTSSLTDGMANTEAIKKIPNWKSLYPVFAACDALNTNGITGWYLPAKQECPVSMVKVNGSAYDIWSSTSNYPNSAETANGGAVNKKTKLPLTPVHRFNYNLYKK